MKNDDGVEAHILDDPAVRAYWERILAQARATERERCARVLEGYARQYRSFPIHDRWSATADEALDDAAHDLRALPDEEEA